MGRGGGYIDRFANFLDNVAFLSNWLRRSTAFDNFTTDNIYRTVHIRQIIRTWTQCAKYSVKDLILRKFYLTFLIINKNKLTYIVQ